MPDIKEIKNIRRYKAGYQVRTEVIDGSIYGSPDFEMKSAYTPDGTYIGDPRIAYFLCKKKGIKPELRTLDSRVCSIGFCEREQKWAGWSHRCIAFFGIGDKIFEPDYGDDDTPFIIHGHITIETLKQARQSASNFAEYIS